MGDRHDSVVARNEETDSTGSIDQVWKRKTPAEKQRQGMHGFGLDEGPANGCPLIPDFNMENIFFDSSSEFDSVATSFLKAVGAPCSGAGESLNSLGGGYVCFSIFGVNIKLELNSYDYEDDYRYMVSIYHDRLSELIVPDATIDLVARIVGGLLVRNLNAVVAIERSDGLEIISGDN